MNHCLRSPQSVLKVFLKNRIFHSLARDFVWPFDQEQFVRACHGLAPVVGWLCSQVVRLSFRTRMNVLVAILGGLSVGVAFGTQDIARNLISGVIVSAERKIVVGEEIEIRGYRGFVEEIGPRSLRIRLEDGRRVLVPSMLFLSQPVVLFAEAEPAGEEAAE